MLTSLFSLVSRRMVVLFCFCVPIDAFRELRSQWSVLFCFVLFCFVPLFHLFCIWVWPGNYYSLPVVNVKSYGYFSVVCASFVISQQISIVTLLLVAFEYLYNENRFSNTQGLFIRYIKHLPFITVSSEPLEVLLIADSCLVAVLVYVVHRLADPSSSSNTESIKLNLPAAGNIISSSLKTIAILFGILLGLSPVLRTLTTSISNDTIWALSVFLLLFHLLFHDYSGGSLRYSNIVKLRPKI